MMRCPKCSRGELHRAKRAGFFAMLAAQFGYYPWKCGQCNHELRLKSRGEKSRKRRSKKTVLPAYSSFHTSGHAEPELDSYK